MTPDVLGAALLDATGQEFQSLLTQAAAVPECLVWLLEQSELALQSSPDRAIRCAVVAAELARRQQDFRAAAIAFRCHAQGFRVLGMHAEALDAFDAASINAQQTDDPLLNPQVQIGRVDSLAWLGRHAEAILAARQLLDDFRRLDSSQDAARVLVNLGNVYYRQDRYHEALECYEEASETLASSGDPVAAATVNFNTANIHSELLQADQAHALFNSAREVFAAQGMQTLTAMCDSNIGVLYQGGGQYPAALAAQQRARTQFEEHSQTLEVAKCTADMADVYRMLNLRSEAMAAYDGAIAVFQQIPLDYERARAELGRAAVLAARGERAEAGEALQRAEAVFRLQGNRMQLAHARLLRAYWLRESSDPGAARAEAHLAARAYARLRLRARAAEARFVAADIALSSGEDAIRVMTGVRRVAREYSLGWLESRAEQSMGRYRAAQGRVNEALKHYRAAVQALESTRTLVPGEDLHTAFVSNKLAIYEDTVAILLLRGRTRDLEEALEYVERSKSRLLLEKVQSALTGENGARSEATGRSAAARIAELRARLTRLYNQIHPDDGDGSKRLLVSHSEHAELLSEVEGEYREALRSAEIETGPGLFSLLRVASPAQLKSFLAPGETLIEYYLVHGTICAFVLSKSEQVKVFANLASASEIEHIARRLRYHLMRAGGAPGYVESHAAQFLSGVQIPLAKLFDLLLRPMLEVLAGELVTIVPHGNLHGLPFHALYDSERSEYVLDRWEITYTPSATVRYLESMYSFDAERSNSAERSAQAGEALVMGVPDVGLEQIAVEVAELAKVLPEAKVFCGPTATLEQFHELAGSSRLIHLATHALFRVDNPLFSGLRFANGWLLARDLYSMRLRCDLVTLSACRTGQAMVESGDEMFGLLRGFLAAGARAVTVSLWPAEDLPTASLMTRFHALMAQGQSRAAALRLAQKYVRRTWQHPYQWAAFALFGER